MPATAAILLINSQCRARSTRYGNRSGWPNSRTFRTANGSDADDGSDWEDDSNPDDDSHHDGASSRDDHSNREDDSNQDDDSNRHDKPTPREQSSSYGFDGDDDDLDSGYDSADDEEDSKSQNAPAQNTRAENAPAQNNGAATSSMPPGRAASITHRSASSVLLPRSSRRLRLSAASSAATEDSCHAKISRNHNVSRQSQDRPFMVCHDNSYQGRLLDDLVNEGYGELGLSTFLAKSARRAHYIRQVKCRKIDKMLRRSKQLLPPMDSISLDAQLLQHASSTETLTECASPYLFYKRLGKIAESQAWIDRQEDLLWNVEKRDKARLHPQKLKNGLGNLWNHSDGSTNGLASSTRRKLPVTTIEEKRLQDGKSDPSTKTRSASAGSLSQRLPSFAKGDCHAATKSKRATPQSNPTIGQIVQPEKKVKRHETGQPYKARTNSKTVTWASPLHDDWKNKENLPTAALGPQPRHEATRASQKLEHMELPPPNLSHDPARSPYERSFVLADVAWQMQQANKLLYQLKARSRVWRVRQRNLVVMARSRGRVSYVRRIA